MTDIHNIKPIIETPIFTTSEMLIIVSIIGALIIGVVSWITYIIWKKFFQENKNYKLKEDFLVVEKIDYKGQAIIKLNKLRKNLDKKDFKEIYLELTMIFKEYVTGSFDVNIEDMTSKEIIIHPKLPDNIKNELENFFINVERVKFANYKEEFDKAKKIFDDVYKFIEK